MDPTRLFDLWPRLIRLYRDQGPWGAAGVLARRLAPARDWAYPLWRLVHDRAVHRPPVPPPFLIARAGDVDGATLRAKALRAGHHHVVITRPRARLHANAPHWFARALRVVPDLALAYGDHDHLTGLWRHDPWFKPDFDPVLLERLDYLGGALLLPVDRLPDGPLDDLAGLARAASRTGRVVHVPRILSHVEARDRARPRPARRPDADRTDPSVWPRVSVLIATRDKGALLGRCLDGLMRRTDYPDLEIVLVDHATTEPLALSVIASAQAQGAIVLRRDGAFNFARFTNDAAAAASGAFLLWLNNDVETRAAGWLKAMVRRALDPDVGAVGARLLYPGGHLQHGGVILGVRGVAYHGDLGLAPGAQGYMGLTFLPRRVSAVTGACLLTQASLFRALGGLDEADLAVAYNDIDYCLKVGRAGKSVIYTPEATLDHWESASRGSDETPERRARLAREIAVMRARWGPVLDADPWYHPALSLDAYDYRPAWPPRWSAPWI